MALLAQGYDDTGAASSTAIIIGILAFPSLVICHIIRVKLRDAKNNEQRVENLQKQVAELENVNAQISSLPQPHTPSNKTQTFTIVHIDDEQWLLDMIRPIIRKMFALMNVEIHSFQNRDEAWNYLASNEPDILITDLCNDNVPGRTEHFGMSGFALLEKLAEEYVQYPILVFSGSLSIEGVEEKAMECAGDFLAVSFLEKPATEEQITSTLAALLDECVPHHLTKQPLQNYRNHEKQTQNVPRPDVKPQSGSGLTKAQQASINEITARAGKPSAELQREIDEIEAAKTEEELVQIFSRGSKVERPTIEAELLSVIMLAKNAELKHNTNAGEQNGNRQQPKPANPTPVGFCPKCKSEVLEGSTGYFCRRRECKFKIGGVIMGQALNKGQVSKLLRNGRTDLLPNFVYESGEHFSACIIIDDAGNVTIEFPK